MDELEKYLKAILLLKLEAADEEASNSKPEILLVSAGFDAKEAAELTGKNVGAVRRAVTRARAAARGQ